jgi:hypothetical protein
MKRLLIRLKSINNIDKIFAGLMFTELIMFCIFGTLSIISEGIIGIVILITWFIWLMVYLKDNE